MPDEILHLKTDPERMKQFCESMARSVPDSGRLMAMLAAVQTFLGHTVDPGTKAGQAYAAVRRELEQAMETAQARVIREGAETLASAIIDRKPTEIAALHRRLSRSGFAAALKDALAAMAPEQAAQGLSWAEEWCSDAYRRGEAASGYPDAPDFGAAGIDYGEYAAMTDLTRQHKD